MSVCVAFNLSDGLVMAVDSATTMSDASGTTTKVFLDADKLFQLGKLRVGIATFGLAAIDGRTIGSFVREFSVLTENSDIDKLSISEIVERLRVFFFNNYSAFAEKLFGIPFDQIPPEKKGILGIVVGGFSPGCFQSELWEIQIPTNSTPNSARQFAAPGQTTFAWFASALPITRYLKGYDPRLVPSLFAEFEGILGRKLEGEETAKLRKVLNDQEFFISVAGMPIQSGIACARFLVDLVQGHYRFAETHPIVGGKTKVGVVAYDHDAFKVIE